jgi:hypothetical protein
MNEERRVSNRRQIELARLVGGRLIGGWGRVAILAIGLMVIVIASSILPMGMAAAAELESSESPAKGPEFWLTRSESRMVDEFEEAPSGGSALNGLEYWAHRARLRVAEAASGSVLAEPEYWAYRSRLGAVEEVEGGASSESPLNGREYWANRARLKAAEVVQGRASSGSPLDGPEFWAARSAGDVSKCTAWSEAVERFYMARPVEDPANGASSLSEAAFYVAKYGAGGATIVTRDGVETYLCEA